MNNQTVLRTENNGVEYFTVVATGESGMSQTGLARACGITQQSLSELVAKLNPTGKASRKTPKPSANKSLNPTTKKGFALSGKAPSKWLEPFLGKDFNLSGNYEKNGGAVKVYTAKFCAAVIKHYAYKGSETAQQFDSGLGIIGLTSFIQSVTGWLPEQFKAAPEAHKKLSEFLNLATEWDRGVMLVVDEEGWEVDMSDSWTFFDAIVFSGFTVEEYLQYCEEKYLLGLAKLSTSETVKLFFERNPDIAERQQPYINQVQKMLNQSKIPERFNRAFIEAFGCEPDDLYLELLTSGREILDARYLQKKALSNI